MRWFFHLKTMLWHRHHLAPDDDEVVTLILTAVRKPEGGHDVCMSQFVPRNRRDFVRVRAAMVDTVMFLQDQVRRGAECPYSPREEGGKVTARSDPSARGETM